jgi:hypothetical protein
MVLTPMLSGKQGYFSPDSSTNLPSPLCMDIYPCFFYFCWHAWMCTFVYVSVSQDADTLFAKSATHDHKLLCQELVTRSKQANIGCVLHAGV